MFGDTAAHGFDSIAVADNSKPFAKFKRRQHIGFPAIQGFGKHDGMERNFGGLAGFRIGPCARDDIADQCVPIGHGLPSRAKAARRPFHFASAGQRSA